MLRSNSIQHHPFNIHFIILFIWDGPNQTDRPQVHCPKGAPQAAGRPEDRPQIRPHRLRRQEAPQIQTRNRCPEIDQEIPKERMNSFTAQLPQLDLLSFPLTYSDRPAHQEAALPEIGEGDCHWVQTGNPIPEPSCAGPPGVSWGLPRVPLRRHQPLRHPRQEGHHHVQGSPAGQTHPWRQVLNDPTTHFIHHSSYINFFPILYSYCLLQAVISGVGK